MAVQLNIPYDTLRELVKQLSADEREHLVAELLQEIAEKRPLTAPEKVALLDSIKLHHKINESPSIRREDWYDNDGRHRRIR